MLIFLLWEQHYTLHIYAKTCTLNDVDNLEVEDLSKVENVAHILALEDFEIPLSLNKTVYYENLQDVQDAVQFTSDSTNEEVISAHLALANSEYKKEGLKVEVHLSSSKKKDIFLAKIKFENIFLKGFSNIGESICRANFEKNGFPKKTYLELNKSKIITMRVINPNNEETPLALVFFAELKRK